MGIRKTITTVALMGAWAVVTALTLGGCTTADRDLPTLSSAAGSSSPRNDEDIARAYADCMSDAGVPAHIDPGVGGKMTEIVYDDQRWWSVVHDAHGAVVEHPSPGITEEQEARMREASAATAPGLVIDGVDHSPEHIECVRQTGYDPSASYDNDEVWANTDPAILARQLEANNRWAACAREHGFPQISDSADGEQRFGSYTPTIYIPYTMDPDQLHLLLMDCPNFNPDNHEQFDQWVRAQSTGGPVDRPPELPPDPNIQLDRIDIEGLSQADKERMMRLFEVLAERSVAYDATHEPLPEPR